MNNLEKTPLEAAEQVFLLSAILAILLLIASIRLIIHLRPRQIDAGALWAMWISVMLVALFAAFTLAASAVTLLNKNFPTLLLLQAFFVISTGGCALFGLLLLTNTLRNLRKELSRRRELETINAEHQSGMEKIILERTANLRQEILERQKLTKQLLGHNKNMESDLRLAGTLQRALMPESIEFPRIRGAIQYHPIGLVSGDVYDRMVNEAGDVYIFCGDAMGHGTPAALFTFMLSAAIRSADRLASPSDILSRINQLLIARNLELYATGVLARISRSGQLAISHAGHESALLLRANGECDPDFKNSGFALGMFDDVQLPYINENRQLESGDRLIFYTDGITEAINAGGNPFGRHRLMSILREHQESSVEQGAATVIEALYDHMDGQPMRDDLTLLVTEYGDFDV